MSDTAKSLVKAGVIFCAASGIGAVVAPAIGAAVGSCAIGVLGPMAVTGSLIAGDLIKDYLSETVNDIHFGVPRNHDLQRACLSALQKALKNQHDLLKQTEGAARWLHGKRLSREHEQWFTGIYNALEEAAKPENEQKLEELFSGEIYANLLSEEAQEAEADWWPIFEHILTKIPNALPLPIELREPLQATLSKDCQTEFGEVLKDPKHQKAWVAFMREVFRQTLSMIGGVQESITSGQENLFQELQSLKESLATIVTVPDLLVQLADSIAKILAQNHEDTKAIQKALGEHSDKLKDLKDAIEKLRMEANGQFRQGEQEIIFSLRGSHDDKLRQILTKDAFVGRKTARRDLDKLARSNSYVLVTAPPGGGKSTLFAQWLNDLEEDDGVQVCYHFFSLQGTGLTGGLACLSEQLLGAHGIEGRVQESEPTRLHCMIQKTLAMPSALPLVVVIDSLDEARGANPNHEGLAFPNTLFPETLGANVTVICSIRTLNGDHERTAEQVSRHLGVKLTPYQLPELDEAATGELLQTIGKQQKSSPLHDKSQDSGFVHQIWERTGGLAIYLRYLIEELARTEATKWQATIDAAPKNFSDWVMNIASSTERDTPGEKLLNVLAFAKGSMSTDDIRKLTDINKRDLSRLSWNVQRWLHITDAGIYSYSHPTIAEAYRQVAFDEGEAATYQQMLVEYCADWSNNESMYALRNYAAHLSETASDDTLFTLMRNEDFRQAQRNIDPGLPLRSLQTALLRAQVTDNAVAMAEFSLAHAHYRLAITHESPLDALRSGNLLRAWELMDMMEDGEYVLFHLLLIWELGDTGQDAEAQRTLDRLLKRLKQEQVHLRHFEMFQAVILLIHNNTLNDEDFLKLSRLLIDDRCRMVLLKNMRLAEKLSVAFEIVEQIESKYLKSKSLQDIAAIQAETGAFAEAIDTAQGIEDEDTKSETLQDIAAIQAETGAFAEAIDTAQGIEDEDIKSETLRDIAIGQAQAGLFVEAIDTAQDIEDEDMKSETLREVAIAQAQAGLFVEAIDTAQGIEDEDIKSETLRDIAIGQAQVGLFAEAVDTAQGIGDEYTYFKIKGGTDYAKSETLRDIAIAQAQAGLFAGAIDTALKIEDDRTKSIALSGIAIAQARAGLFTEAIDTAQGVEDENIKSETLRDIAIAQAQAGLFLEAVDTAQGVENEDRKSETLRDIAIAQARAGLFLETFDTALKIKGDRTKSKALSDIAIVQAQAGLFAEAIDTAQGVEDENIKSATLRDIAIAQAQAGLFLEAVDTAQGVENEDRKSETLRDIAIAQARAGLFLETFDTALKIKGDRTKSKALSDIAIVQAQAGLFAEAIDTAQGVEDENIKSETLRGIAIGQAQVGLFAEAVDTAQGIGDEYTYFKIKGGTNYAKSETLRDIAIAQAQAGLFAGAIDTALKIEDDRTKSIALSGIAIAQARAGLFTEAIDTAQGVEDENIKSATLRDIALAQTRARLFAEAVDTVQTIKYEDIKSATLGDIAAAQTRAGLFAEAVATALKVEHNHTRANILSDIAATQAPLPPDLDRDAFAAAWVIAQTNEDERTISETLTGIATVQAVLYPDAARDTFSKAVDTAQSIEGEDIKSETLRDIAIAQAQAGLFTEAFNTVQTIKYEDIKSVTLRDIAAIQAKIGSFAEAIATAQGIEDEDIKSKTLKDIAIAQAQARLFAEAIDTAQGIKYEDIKSDALRGIAIAQAQARLFTEAIDTALKIEDDFTDLETWGAQDNYTKSKTLKDIAIAQAQAGLFAEAFDTALEIESSTQNTQAFAGIVAAQAQAGLFAGAIDTALKIEDDRTKSIALSGIAIAQARAGLFTEAIDTALEIEVDRTKSKALSDIAVTQNPNVAHDTFAMAIVVALNIDEEDTIPAALSDIAVAQARLYPDAARDTFNKAIATVLSIRDKYRESVFLANIAESQARAHMLDLALQTANQIRVNNISDERSRAEALLEISILHAKNKCGYQAVKIAAEISIDRNEHLPAVAAAIAEVHDLKNFKRLLIPCAYDLDATYMMCGLLADLYPQQATAIAAIVMNQQIAV